MKWFLAILTALILAAPLQPAPNVIITIHEIKHGPEKWRQLNDGRIQWERNGTWVLNRWSGEANLIDNLFRVLDHMPLPPGFQLSGISISHENNVVEWTVCATEEKK